MALVGRFSAIMILATYFVQLSVSWPTGIDDLSVCVTFLVSHNVRPLEVSTDAVSVTLKRVEDGGETSCVEPNTLYHIEFRSNETTMVQGKPEENRIRGFLIDQEPAGSITPPGKVLGRGYLPKNTVHGVCGAHSIAHKCPSNSGCDLGDGGKWLNITYDAPSRLKVEEIVFRYSVVLSRVGGISKFIANKRVKFPVCPPVSTTAKPPVHTTNQPTMSTECPTLSLEAHETNSAEEPVQYCSNFKPKDGAVKQNQNCGRRVETSNETHLYTDPVTGINYTCHTNKTVKRVHCTQTCSNGSQQLCCRNTRTVFRPRDFRCYASSLLNPGVILTEEARRIERLKVQVLQTKQCECYLCKDIVCNSNCSGQQ